MGSIAPASILLCALPVLQCCREAHDNVVKSQVSNHLFDVDNNLVEKRFEKCIENIDKNEVSIHVLSTTFISQFSSRLIEGMVDPGCRTNVRQANFQDPLDQVRSEAGRLAFELGTQAEWKPDLLERLSWRRIAFSKFKWVASPSRRPFGALEVNGKVYKVDVVPFPGAKVETLANCLVSGWLSPSESEDGYSRLLITDAKR